MGKTRDARAAQPLLDLCVEVGSYAPSDKIKAAILDLGAIMIPTLIEAATKPAPGVSGADNALRRKAVELLAEIPGERASAPLIALATNREEFLGTRGYALAALVFNGDGSQTRSVASGVLQDRKEDPWLRGVAAAVLSRHPSPEVFGLLAASVVDSDEAVRTKVVEALGFIQDQRVVDLLAPAMNDADPSVRNSAARGVGRLKSERSFELLQQAWLNRDRNNRDPDLAPIGIVAGMAVLGDRRGIDMLVEAADDDSFIFFRKEIATWAWDFASSDGALVFRAAQESAPRTRRGALRVFALRKAEAGIAVIERALT